MRARRIVALAAAAMLAACTPDEQADPITSRASQAAASLPEEPLLKPDPPQVPSLGMVIPGIGTIVRGNDECMSIIRPNGIHVGLRGRIMVAFDMADKNCTRTFSNNGTPIRVFSSLQILREENTNTISGVRVTANSGMVCNITTMPGNNIYISC